jgi:hypothetical protein
MVVSNTLKITVSPAVASINISVSPTSLSASGGDITITGTTDLPNGTTITINISESISGYSNSLSTSVSSGGFSTSTTLPANLYASSLTYSVQATATYNGSPVNSNVVDVTEAAPTPSITLSSNTTSLPSSGGTVTFFGSVVGINPGTVLYVFSNGIQVTTTKVGSRYTFGFEFTLSFPANTTLTAETYTIDVSTDQSNT